MIAPRQRRARYPRWGPALMAIACLSGCAKRETKRPAKTPDAASVPVAANKGDPFTHCLRLRPKQSKRLDSPTLKIGGLSWSRRGARLVARAGTGGELRRLRLGVLADTNQALPQTLHLLDALVKRFRTAKVDAILMLGGLEATYEGLLAVLSRTGGLPLLALPGDRESQAGFSAAMRNVQPTPAIDLTLTHAVELPHHTLIAVPGYFLAHHLLAREQGCGYTGAELDALAREIADTSQPRILLAHGPPLGEGAHAIDRGLGAINIGDPQLTRLLKKAEIRFGLFGHVHEAGGHATTVDGRPVGPNIWSKSLLLNVGSADAIPHEDLRGSFVGPMAVIVEFQGGKARYRLLRALNDRLTKTKRRRKTR